MAPKTNALTAKDLEPLGAERLAELVMEFSPGDAATKRRLRLELAATQSASELTKEVSRRLNGLAKARSFVDRRQAWGLAADLDTQRRAIVDIGAKGGGSDAFDLLWRFMALSGKILERCDDSDGDVGGVFRDACLDFGELAQPAGVGGEPLANQVYDALVADEYGLLEELIRVLAPALGTAGLEHLKQRMTALSQTPVEQPAQENRRVIGRSLRGPDIVFYADTEENSARAYTARQALLAIAVAQGDSDAFIAQYDEEERKKPAFAARIARMFLSTGRAAEALQILDASRASHADVWSRSHSYARECDEARVDALEALGRTDDAQAARWDEFQRTLSNASLRDYLDKLPDFDDIEAEEKALDHVSAYPNWYQALSFLIEWPALDRAAALVMERTAKLNGDSYELLEPAAAALAAQHPLAATLALRAMITFVLNGSRSTRYKHAARNLLECSSLSSSITDFGTFETHEDFEAGLRQKHGRKASFWLLVDRNA